jgi:hypothetical protein
LRLRFGLAIVGYCQSTEKTRDRRFGAGKVFISLGLRTEKKNPDIEAGAFFWSDFHYIQFGWGNTPRESACLARVFNVWGLDRKLVGFCWHGEDGDAARSESKFPSRTTTQQTQVLRLQDSSLAGFFAELDDNA